MTRVIGQQRAVHFLNGLVHKGRIPHALLLSGENGTGAAAAALTFARVLHCENEDNLPCLKCNGCLKTSGLNHPDLSILFPFSARTKEETVQTTLRQVVADPYGYTLPDDHATISVDQIRGLQRQFAYGAYQGSWRTSVIMHADRMRPESANALLKTLEEPPPQSLIILVVSQVEVLLPTIISRCQFLKFPPLQPEDIQVALIERGLEEMKAGSVARSCGGNFRRALEVEAGNLAELQDRAFRFLDALVWGADGRTYAALEQLASDRQAVFDVLKHAEAWLRDALLLQADKQTSVVHAERMEDVQRLADAFDVGRLCDTVSQLESLREMNARNVNLQLGLLSFWRSVRGYAA
ncbi:MAG: DNA polymerase III subunit delta' [Candidatus Latescibacteria bacterium]|nr:DNA polymerase III subunit delta' [Candidatus Latescibacterota bacterium]